MKAVGIVALGLVLAGNSIAKATSDGASPQSSGTGFGVSPHGHILTNHHVVDGCASIRATIEGVQRELTVVGTDAHNDLALLKLPGSMQRFARFREGRNIRSGDNVVLVRFPLSGLLASEANVTTGTVSALAGLGNDTRFIQMTAPVQPGSSGGPVFDQSGNIVGVVVSKLNTLIIAKATGDIPQNINFAINGAVAKAFLESHGVSYETAPSGKKKYEPAEIGAAAKAFTFLLECYSKQSNAEQRAIEAERRALEAERRALESERQAFAEARRDQEAREHARLLELEEREKKGNKERADGVERVASEEQRRQKQQDLEEGQAASDRVIQFHKEEHAREAIEELERRILSKERQTLSDGEKHASGVENERVLAEARRKGQEARARARTELEGSARDAKKEVERQAMSEGADALAEARRKGQEARSSGLVTPSRAFDQAYSNYHRGKYESAILGFQSFMKQFPSASQVPKAQYFLGESYYQQGDYESAIETLERLCLEYPENANIPAALYRVGLAALEMGDPDKAKKSFKHVIEKFSKSDVAKLATIRLKTIR